MVWSMKNSGEVLSKLKSRGFRATSLSTYDFSTLYTRLPIIYYKKKFLISLGVPSKSSTKMKIHYILPMKVYFILPVTIRKCFSLLQTIEDIHFGLTSMYVTPSRIFCIIFTPDMVISYTNKLLVFRLGTNCAALVVDLFLFCYERDFMTSLSDDNQADTQPLDI